MSKCAVVGYIKEPIGIDFVVDSKPLTTDDRKLISDAIYRYKTTGKKGPVIAPLKRRRKKTTK